jgi:surface protein
MESIDVKLVIQDRDTLDKYIVQYLEETPQTLPDISLWDVTAVTDMEHLFVNKIKTTQKNTKIQGIKEWDVSKVEYMDGMFYGCDKFNIDLSKWEIKEATNLSVMFAKCESFNSKIFKLNPENKVNTTFDMFYGCTAFNQNISDWDVSNVTNMKGMFSECTSFNSGIFELKEGYKIKNMSEMFYNCIAFNQDISKWNVSQVKVVSKMLYGCKNFKQNLSGWILHSKASTTGMIFGCPYLEKNPSYQPKKAQVTEATYDTLPQSRGKTPTSSPQVDNNSLIENPKKTFESNTHERNNSIKEPFKKFLSSLKVVLTSTLRTIPILFPAKEDLEDIYKKTFFEIWIEKVLYFIEYLLENIKVTGGRRHISKKQTKRNRKNGGILSWLFGQSQNDKTKRQTDINNLSRDIADNQCLPYDELKKCRKVIHYLRNMPKCDILEEAVEQFLKEKDGDNDLLKCDTRFIELRNQLYENFKTLEFHLFKYKEIGINAESWLITSNKLANILKQTNQQNINKQIDMLISLQIPESSVDGGSRPARNKRKTRRHRKKLSRRISSTLKRS